MINKYIVFGIILNIITFAYLPGANADYKKGSRPINASINATGNGSVNAGAWHQFVLGKQRQYEAEHTLERSPFPQTISDSNIIKVNLSLLAWGAYDGNGNLVRWGNASGGKSFCPDIGKACKTVTGTYTIYNKKGSGCKSNLFPVPRGGAPMPYCMHFQGGYALHGGAVPDFNASHGCVRVPPFEAKWLNQNFVTVGKTRINITY
ncbi:MAG: L,D-transpeptidase [Candidatus Berkiellales bacterium]